MVTVSPVDLVVAVAQFLAVLQVVLLLHLDKVLQVVLVFWFLETAHKLEVVVVLPQ
jgi:hypothetical protein